LLRIGIATGPRDGGLQLLKGSIGATLLKVVNHVHAAFGGERRRRQRHEQRQEQCWSNTHEYL
jgi:hypothetical protein